MASKDPIICQFSSNKRHRWVTVREYNKGGKRYKVEKCSFGDAPEKHTSIGKATK